jgi:hypothetical protein
MFIHRTPISCGILELSQLYIWPPVTGLVRTALKLYENECYIQRNMHPFVTFSDVKDGHGHDLAEGLSKYGLVKKSRALINPNTGNAIILYVWMPSQEYMQKVSKRTGARLRV